MAQIFSVGVHALMKPMSAITGGLFMLLFLFVQIRSEDGQFVMQSGGSISASKELPRTHLIIGIVSKGSNFQKRDAIRKTWMNFAREDTRMKAFFFCGFEDGQPTPELINEQSENGDIVFYDGIDEYVNLGNKTLALVMYAKENFQFDYLMKADDDTFIRLDRILSILEDLPHKAV
eukprot:482172_1